MSSSARRRIAPDDRATRWAADVVDGKVVAGELAIAACERHLRDIAEGERRGIFWRPEKAARAIRFFPACLSVTAGSAEGKPFDLLAWHKFCVGSLFGWVKESGRLRFRRGYMETGKGQAKSPLMAAIGLYFTGYHGVKRAEVYAIGEDRKVANVLFRDAVAMCRAPIPGHDEGDTLENLGHVIIRGTGDNAWKIEHPSSSSRFQPLANGEAISGPRPTAVLADEIHEFKDAGPLETWARAIAKMPGDAMMLLGTNTPASTQIVGTQYSEFFQAVAKGQARDDEAFAFIARVDKDDRKDIFDNETVWAKALPALGQTFPIENIRGEVATARILLSTAMSVKRLYFGIPIGAVEFWIREEAWAAALGEVDPDRMRGLPCWLSLDLSQKNDLTALTAVWRDDEGREGPKGHLYSFTWYWTTREGLEERALKDNAMYVEWVEEGFLEAVPGAVIHKSFVAAKVSEIVAEHDVRELDFDPAGIKDFEAACEEEGLAVWIYEGEDGEAGDGLKMVKHAQGTRVAFEEKQHCMPRSIERLEDAILIGRITIDQSPVTYMCAGNAALIHDGQKNRAFDKKRSRGRIDGLVTNAMAVGAAEAGVEEGEFIEGEIILV